MNRDYQLLGLVTQVGLTIVVSILIGLGAGLWIDSTFQTKPCATLILALVGIAAGSYGVYRMVSQAIDQAAGVPPSVGKGRDSKDEEDEE